ncbi:TPA: glycosyltransferase, partial [Escherichia coli]|nr:glycosyltransferase [Escherichia coli]
GPAESSLKSMVQSLSLNENIIFVGDQDRVTIAKYLNMSDVFMFLTKRIEGLPLNVLEAQASGLPMIISKHLFFEQTELVNKVDNKDIKKAAEILIQILSENNEVSRKSYINEINTLDYSTKLYHELLN